MHAKSEHRQYSAFAQLCLVGVLTRQSGQHPWSIPGEPRLDGSGEETTFQSVKVVSTARKKNNTRYISFHLSLLTLALFRSKS